jgi:thiol-disulfide isomerase/thioredoxin/outer membrane lipoprotein-sorting protein
MFRWPGLLAPALAPTLASALALAFLLSPATLRAEMASTDSAAPSPSDSTAQARYDAMIESIRSARSLSWQAEYSFSAGGQGGRCSYRMWLKKPGFGRMEAIMPASVTGVGEVVTGVIVGDGENFWIHWPAGFPGTRSWDPGHTGAADTHLYMRREFAPSKYSFSHDAGRLGSCLVLLASEPSLFHGGAETSFELGPFTDLGMETLDGQECDGVRSSLADGQRTVDYWIARTDQIPRRVRAVAHVAQDIVVEETWTGLSRNAEIPDSLFHWTPPEGSAEYAEPSLEATLLPEGAAAPDFHTTPLEGAPFRLSDFRGKVVLLNFWRIGCPPCRKELPILERLHQRLGPDGLVVIGYDEADDSARLLDLLGTTGVTYPCVLDTSDAGSRWKLGYTTSENASADPLTYIIGRDGRVVSRWFGFSEEILHDGLTKAGLRP